MLVNSPRSASFAALVLALLLAPAGARSADAPPTAASHDPFAYCAAVGSVDAPDSRYRGPTMPQSVAHGLQKALGGAPAAAVRHAFWRCMDGKVYACTVGANLPCRAKADARRTASKAMVSFCKDQPDADVIPAYVTGRTTIYAWHCEEGVAAVDRQVWQVDARGFIAEIWHQIPPP